MQKVESKLHLEPQIPAEADGAELERVEPVRTPTEQASALDQTQAVGEAIAAVDETHHLIRTAAAEAELRQVRHVVASADEVERTAKELQTEVVLANVKIPAAAELKRLEAKPEHVAEPMSIDGSPTSSWNDEQTEVLAMLPNSYADAESQNEGTSLEVSEVISDLEPTGTFEENEHEDVVDDGGYESSESAEDNLDISMLQNPERVAENAADEVFADDLEISGPVSVGEAFELPQPVLATTEPIAEESSELPQPMTVTEFTEFIESPDPASPLGLQLESQIETLDTGAGSQHMYEESKAIYAQIITELEQDILFVEALEMWGAPQISPKSNLEIEEKYIFYTMRLMECLGVPEQSRTEAIARKIIETLRDELQEARHARSHITQIQHYFGGTNEVKPFDEPWAANLLAHAQDSSQQALGRVVVDFSQRFLAAAWVPDASDI